MGKLRRQMSESLVLGVLLAAVGGFFNAYTFITRGGVFASAQTGNIVLLCVSLAKGEFLASIRYMLPIFAFACGVVIAESIKRHCKEDANIHWRQVVLLVETLVIIAVAFMPQSQNVTANIMISFVCAMQVESFRKVDGNAIATTMCTGNLRSCMEQLVIWRQTGKRDAGKSGMLYLAIIGTFACGALFGGIFTSLLGDKAVLLCGAILLISVIIMFSSRNDRSK